MTFATRGVIFSPTRKRVACTQYVLYVCYNFIHHACTYYQTMGADQVRTRIYRTIDIKPHTYFPSKRLSNIYPCRPRAYIDASYRCNVTPKTLNQIVEPLLVYSNRWIVSSVGSKVLRKGLSIYPLSYLSNESCAVESRYWTMEMRDGISADRFDIYGSFLYGIWLPCGSHHNT